MQDTALYEELLGIRSPWKVRDVKLDVERQRVDVWVEHGRGGQWACSHCDTVASLYDHVDERAWRHLDSCQCRTYLHARIPRVSCPTHGVVQVRVPWAEPQSRFTQLFERLAIDVLRECDVTGATRILGLSWDEAWHLIERAVKRGHARKPERVVRQVGVDEKAAAKGHRYLTLVCDLDAGTVEYVGEDRKQESLAAYYRGLSETQREGIEAVAMDMWEPYIQATRAQIPKAAEKIVFDRFHLMGYLSKAVDTVRKHEHKTLKAQGDETLTGTKYLWLYNREHVPRKRRREFVALRRLDLKVGRAWALKEALRRLWQYRAPAVAWRYWRWWYYWATHSRLQPIRDAAATLKRHLANIMTYFRHRITNAVSEGLNSKIQTIKQRACGFRNTEHFKTAIYFHCGGLELYPH